MAMSGREAVVHTVTASRILVVLATYAVIEAWRAPLAVLGLVLLAVGTDVLDGALARRWGVASEFGANLDSAVDLVFYLSLVAWVWMWNPAVIREIAPFVVVFTALYVASLAFAKVRRGTMGFHNGWTRMAATVGIVVAMWVILEEIHPVFGWDPVLLWVLVAAGLLDLGQRFAKTIRSRPGERASPEPVDR